jgi:2-C-methyl-D-erythritol 4-phosphate cytidylyltransferase
VVETKVFAIIAASGLARRMGGVNKQLLKLGGKPVAVRSTEAFQKNPLVNGIVIVTRKENIRKMQDLVSKHKLSKVKAVIEGGEERQDSVHNGLLEVKRLGGCDIVTVHNGANPLVSSEEIADSINAAAKYGAAVVANPVKDTIRFVQKSGFSVATPERKSLWAMQTPQAMKFNLALKAFEKARREKFYGTDDVQLVEKIGGRVKIVPGRYENFKITTPHDVLLAESILKTRRTRGR